MAVIRNSSYTDHQYRPVNGIGLRWVWGTKIFPVAPRLHNRSCFLMLLMLSPSLACPKSTLSLLDSTGQYLEGAANSCHLDKYNHQALWMYCSVPHWLVQNPPKCRFAATKPIWLSQAQCKSNKESGMVGAQTELPSADGFTTTATIITTKK
jgi:hypothetical protein